MKTNISVRDAMTKRPIYAKANISIKECAKIMKKYDVGSLLVVDDKNNLLGIVTEEDFVRRAIANEIDLNEPILNISTKTVFTINYDADIFDAITKMKELNIRHLPVVNEDNKLVGLITMKDILRLEPQLFDIIVDKIRLREEEEKLFAISKQRRI